MSDITSPAARLLARLMSDLSEEYFCAGWLTNCEYALWAALTGQEIAGIKAWKISSEEHDKLRLMHELAGGWIVWSDEERGEAFLRDDEWMARLTARDQSQNSE